MSLLKEILYGLAGGAFGAFPLSFSGLASLAGHFTGIETQTDGLAALCVIGGTALAFLLRYFRKISASLAGTFRMLISMVWKGFSYEKEATADQRDAVMTLLSVLPTALVFPIGSKLTVIMTDGDVIVEGICFLLCGAVLTAACRNPVTDRADGQMRADHALIIGTVCALSVLSGISAVAVGMSVAVLLGYEPSFAFRRSLLPSLTAELFSVLSGPLDAAAGTDITVIAVSTAAAAAAGLAAVWLSGILIKKEKITIFAYISLAVGLAAVIAGTVETASGMTWAELIDALKG